MSGILLQMLTTTPPIEDPWGDSDVVVYVLLGVGLILTVAVATIFFFILARGDREE